MVFRFWYELGFGVIALISILIFGPKGMVAIVPIAFLPIIMRVKKIKADERETQLFFKGTQYIVNSIVIIILLAVFAFKVQLADFTNISAYSINLVAVSILILVSLLRLYIFYKH